MDFETEIEKLQEKILRQYPNWSCEKARWMAMQCLGVAGFGIRK